MGWLEWSGKGKGKVKIQGPDQGSLGGQPGRAAVGVGRLLFALQVGGRRIRLSEPFRTGEVPCLLPCSAVWLAQLVVLRIQEPGQGAGPTSQRLMNPINVAPFLAEFTAHHPSLGLACEQ